ncbi:hypothetical protein ACU8NW_02550 [Rhizobium leguminosarum]
MSIDTHSPTVAGFVCEAVTTDTIASPCLHSRLANIARREPAGIDRHPSHADDPAVLIGLALAFVRQDPPLDGRVPEPLMRRLSALADAGNAACRVLLDRQRNRNRDFGRSGNEHLTRSALLAASAESHRLRRSPRERVLAATARPDPLDGRKRLRTRRRDPVWNPETAIIAAETGGRADG